MSFNVCKIKNIDSVTHTYVGQDIAAGVTYTIEDTERVKWTITDALLEDIANLKAQVYDSVGAIDGISNQINWLKNYDGHPSDSDNAPLARFKITKTGWGLSCFAVNFSTSTLNSVYSKDKDGNDYNFTTLKFYDSSNNELTTQSAIDSSCVKTEIKWEPTWDFEIIGGELWQDTDPTTNIYGWLYHSYSGHEFCTGGMNLRLIGPNSMKEMDGRAPKLMPYTEGYHTNELTCVVRHDAGVKIMIMLILEIYKA